MTPNTYRHLSYVIILLICAVALISCTQAQIDQLNKSAAEFKGESIKTTSTISLSWEDTTEPHPERKPWSAAIVHNIDKNFSIFDKASDIKTFCPKYDSMTKEQKIKAIAELLVAVTYYESGYNPKASSVDVGSASDKNTWSIGLFQMSVVDQKNYKLNTNYTYNELLTAIPNIDLAMQILVKQIQKQNKYVVSSGIYWAVLSGKPNSKYTKVPQIAGRVKKKAPGCI